MNNKHKPFSMHLDVSDFLPADKEEKQSLVIMRESVSFWRDGARRFKKNKIAMTSLVIIILIFIFSFILPSFYPYAYEQQIRGSENLAPMEYSQAELERMASGESVFPHFLGTDSLGRDITARLMMGSRISLLVGLVASILVLIIGSLYGSIAGYFGGKVDMIMMRVVDIIYTVPDILIIILLMVTLKYPLQDLANNVPGFAWINTIGIGLISIFIVFSLLYWVGLARIVRGQILTLKEQEYVTAARALGASHRRIIGKHLLTNCMGPDCYHHPSNPVAIFTESFLSFIGIGVQAPMPSLGSMAANAIGGIYSYPHRLLRPPS